MGEKENFKKSIRYLGGLNTDEAFKNIRVVTGMNRFDNNLNEEVILLLLKYRTQLDGLKHDANFLLSTLWNEVEVQFIEKEYENLISLTSEWYEKLLQIYNLKIKYEDNFKLSISNLSQLECLSKICVESQKFDGLNYPWFHHSISSLRESVSKGEQFKAKELDIRNKVSVNYDTEVLYHYDYSEVSRLLNSLHTEFTPSFLEELLNYSSVKKLEEKAQEVQSFFYDLEQILSVLLLTEYQNFSLTEIGIESVYQLVSLLQERESIPRSWLTQSHYNYHKIFDLIEENKVIQNNINEKLAYYTKYFSKDNLNPEAVYMIEDDMFEYYYENRDFLCDDIKSLMYHINQVNIINDELVELLGYGANNTIHEISEILDILYLSQGILYCEDSWINKEEIERIKSKSVSLMSKITEVKLIKEKILVEFKEEIFEYFNLNLNQRFSEEFVSIFRFLKKQYREDMKQLNLLYKGESKLSFSQAQKLISKLTDYHQQLDQLNYDFEQNKQLFGPLNQGIETDFHMLEKNFELIDQIMSIGKSKGLSLKEIKSLINSNITNTQLDEYRELYNNSLNSISEIIKKHELLLAKLKNYKFETLQNLNNKVTTINIEVSNAIVAINKILICIDGEVPDSNLFKLLMTIHGEIEADLNNLRGSDLYLKTIFEEDYQGLNTEWGIIKQKLEWFEKVRECAVNISIFTQRSLNEIFEIIFLSDNICIFDEKHQFLEKFLNIKPIYDLFIEKANYKLQLTINDVKEKLILHKNLLHSWGQLVSYLSLYRNSRVSNFNSLEQELKLLVDYWALRVELGEVGPLLRSQFGTAYKGVLTDWTKINCSLDYYTKFQTLLSENSIILSENLWYQLTRSKTASTINELTNVINKLQQIDSISDLYAQYFKNNKINIKLGPLDELVEYFNQLNKESTKVFKLKQYLVLKFEFEQRGFGELFEQLMLNAEQETMVEHNQSYLGVGPLYKQTLYCVEANEVIEEAFLNSDTAEVVNKRTKSLQESIDVKLSEDEDTRTIAIKNEENTNEEFLETEIISGEKENCVKQTNFSSSEQNTQVEVQHLDKDKIELMSIDNNPQKPVEIYLLDSDLKDNQTLKIKQLKNVLLKENKVNSICETVKTRRISDKGLSKIYSKLKLQYNLKVDDRILEAKNLKYPTNAISFTDIYYDIKAKLESLQEQFGVQIPLGLIYLDENQYKYLKFYTKDVILTYYNALDYPTALLITVCLVQIIEREFDGSDFWGSIFNSLGLKDSTQLRRLMQEATQALCVSENLYFHFTTHEKKIRRNYRSTIMMHAIVSNKSSQSLFDFIYDFYLEDLNEMYQNQIVHEKLNELINLIDEDLDWSKGETSANEVDSSSIYQLSLFTKMAIVYYESVLIEVLKNIIYNMHSFQFKTKDYKSDPIRFYELYRQWRSQFVVRNLIQGNSNFKSNTNNNIRKKHHRKFSKASYVLRDRELILCIPEQPIEKRYVHSNLYIEFYEKNECLLEFTRELELYGKVNFKTDEIELAVNKVYKQLSYKIVADNNIIYDSKNILHREYLTFDEQLKEKVYNNQPSHSFYLVANKEDLVTIDGFYNEYSEKDYKIYSLQLEKEDQVVLNNQVLFNQTLPEGIKKCVLDNTYLRQDIRIETPSNEYQVYTEYPILKCSLYDTEISNYYIEVNGCSYEMKSLPHLLLNQNSERLKKYEFKLSANIFELGKLYSVILRKKNDNQIIFSTKFIIIDKLNYQLDKEFYYQDQMLEVLNLEAKNITLLEHSFPVTKDIRYTNEIKFDCMTIENLSVKLVIGIPKISWRLSEAFNSEQGSKYLLAEDLYRVKELNLSVPYKDYHLIAIGKNGLKFIEPVREGCYKLDSLKNLEEDYITIGLLITETSVQIPLFEVWYHATLKNITFEYLSGEEPKIQIDYDRVGEFIGTVKLYNSEKSLLNEVNIDLNIENSLLIDAKVSRERCLVQVIQLIEDEFGFSSEEVIIFETTLFTGDDLLSEVKDNVLEVKLCDVDGIQKVVNNFYLTDFKVIREGVDYEAIGFYKKERAGVLVPQKLDDKINPINIHILGRQHNKLQFTLTDNVGDGFVYHKESQKLAYLNTKDRESYDYPDFYLLDLHK